MKSLILFATLLIFTSIASSQELLTIREVFDFEIEDKFHYEGLHPDQPPNAERVTIIDKYYSENGDTLFYIKYH